MGYATFPFVLLEFIVSSGRKMYAHTCNKIQKNKHITVKQMTISVYRFTYYFKFYVYPCNTYTVQDLRINFSYASFITGQH